MKFIHKVKTNNNQIQDDYSEQIIQLVTNTVTINPNFMRAAQNDRRVCDISYGQWKITKAKNAVKWIKNWNIIQQADFSNNKETDILKQLTNINFLYLEQLSLSNNSIYSVESISRINLPNIKTLDISNNQITTIYCISKSQFRSITKILMSNNYVNEIKQQLISFQKLVNISIQWKYDRQQINYSLHNLITKLQRNHTKTTKQATKITLYKQFLSNTTQPGDYQHLITLLMRRTQKFCKYKLPHVIISQ